MSHPATSDRALHPRIRLWVLRLIVGLRLEIHYISDAGFIHKWFAAEIGYPLPPEEQPDPEGHRTQEIFVGFATLKRWLAQSEAERHLDQGFPILSANLSRMATAIGLGEVELAMLEFIVALGNHSLLNRVLSDADIMRYDPRPEVSVLSAALLLPEAVIRHSLGADGILSQSGLLTVNYGEVRSFQVGSSESMFQMPGVDLAFKLYSQALEPADILQDMISPGRSPSLSLDDYAHIGDILQVLQPYLAHAIKTRRQGVNIFIHGLPGTGKTELVRTLAQALGGTLYEVVHEDSCGMPLGIKSRLQAAQAAQFILKEPRVLLMFDEVEEIFKPAQQSSHSGTAHANKAWVNRMLEQNSIPTLWISNVQQGMDPSFTRRFDLVFELDMPPRAQRVRILQAHSQGLLHEEQIERIAQHPALAPAVVARAASVIGCVAGQIGSASVGPAFERLLNNTLKAQGHDRIADARSGQVLGRYDARWVNIDQDLEVLAAGIQQSRGARVCLYGPSGTGKTAWARWLAEKLECPLLVKRGSDLLGPYLGESERNIAAAFAEAQADQAVLLIDEIDSFLAQRHDTAPQWHYSMVNEMLTQIEGFEGVLVATTNMIRHLDQAALRRFDLKLKLDFLRAEQALALFSDCCEALGLGRPVADEAEAVRRLRHLTVGDFVAVQRQHRFQPVRDAASLLAALKQGCGLKNAVSSERIGFL